MYFDVHAQIKEEDLSLLVNRMVVIPTPIPTPIPINIPIIVKITIQLLLVKQNFGGFGLTSTELSSSIFMSFKQKSRIEGPISVFCFKF